MPVIIKKAPFHRCIYGVFVVKMRFVAKTGDTVINRAEHGGGKVFFIPKFTKKTFKICKNCFKICKKDVFFGLGIAFIVKTH